MGRRRPLVSLAGGIAASPSHLSAALPAARVPAPPSFHIHTSAHPASRTRLSVPRPSVRLLSHTARAHAGRREAEPLEGRLPDRELTQRPPLWPTPTRRAPPDARPSSVGRPVAGLGGTDAAAGVRHPPPARSCLAHRPSDTLHPTLLACPRAPRTPPRVRGRGQPLYHCPDRCSRWCAHNAPWVSHPVSTEVCAPRTRRAECASGGGQLQRPPGDGRTEDPFNERTYQVSA